MSPPTHLLVSCLSDRARICFPALPGAPNPLLPLQNTQEKPNDPGNCPSSNHRSTHFDGPGGNSPRPLCVCVCLFAGVFVCGVRLFCDFFYSIPPFCFCFQWPSSATHKRRYSIRTGPRRCACDCVPVAFLGSSSAGNIVSGRFLQRPTPILGFNKSISGRFFQCLCLCTTKRWQWSSARKKRGWNRLACYYLPVLLFTAFWLKSFFSLANFSSFVGSMYLCGSQRAWRKLWHTFLGLSFLLLSSARHSLLSLNCRADKNTSNVLRRTKTEAPLKTF